MMLVGEVITDEFHSALEMLMDSPEISRQWYINRAMGVISRPCAVFGLA